jgi:hypothetical protein
LLPETKIGGIGSGPSLPTYPLANTFNAVVVVVCFTFDTTDVNADTRTAESVNRRQIDFIMVECFYFALVYALNRAIEEYVVMQCCYRNTGETRDFKSRIRLQLNMQRVSTVTVAFRIDYTEVKISSGYL